MIHASFFHEDCGFRVIIEGHANYAPEGQDIVCASVSSLLYALIGYLRTCGDGRCRVHKLKKGYAEMSCSFECEEFLRMACIGILQISEQYPECVRVHNGIWRSRLCALDASMAAPSRHKSGETKGVCIHGRKNFFGFFRRRRTKNSLGG